LILFYVKDIWKKKTKMEAFLETDNGFECTVCNIVVHSHSAIRRHLRGNRHRRGIKNTVLEEETASEEETGENTVLERKLDVLDKQITLLSELVFKTIGYIHHGDNPDIIEAKLSVSEAFDNIDIPIQYLFKQKYKVDKLNRLKEEIDMLSSMFSSAYMQYVDEHPEKFDDSKFFELLKQCKEN